MGMGSERNGGPAVQGLMGCSGSGGQARGHWRRGMGPLIYQGHRALLGSSQVPGWKWHFPHSAWPGGLCMAPPIISQEMLLS